MRNLRLAEMDPHNPLGTSLVPDGQRQTDTDPEREARIQALEAAYSLHVANHGRRSKSYVNLEHRVADLVACGLGERQIRDRIGIDIATVRKVLKEMQR